MFPRRGYGRLYALAVTKSGTFFTMIVSLAFCLERPKWSVECSHGPLPKYGKSWLALNTITNALALFCETDQGPRANQSQLSKSDNRSALAKGCVFGVRSGRWNRGDRSGPGGLGFVGEIGAATACASFAEWYVDRIFQP